MAYQAGAYPGFLAWSHEEFLYSALDGMPIHRMVTPSIKFAGTHLYTVRVNCLAQQHNTMPRPGLGPGPLDPETNALTMRPPRLPLVAKGSRFWCYFRQLFMYLALRKGKNDCKKLNIIRVQIFVH